MLVEKARLGHMWCAGPSEGSSPLKEGEHVFLSFFQVMTWFSRRQAMEFRCLALRTSIFGFVIVTLLVASCVSLPTAPPAPTTSTASTPQSQPISPPLCSTSDQTQTARDCCPTPTPAPQASLAAASATSLSTLDVKKDFGAVGDGVHDDTCAIQAALNAFNTWNLINTPDQPNFRGGEIVFPSGVYRITRTLVIPNFVTLKGYGATNKAQNTHRAPSVILKDCSCDGLVVLGDSATVSDLQVDGCLKLQNDAMAGCDFEYDKCWDGFANSGDGILVLGGSATLRNVAVTNQGGVGIRIGGKSETEPGYHKPTPTPDPEYNKNTPTPPLVYHNSNSWRVYDVAVVHNGSDGLVIHDAQPTQPNANAGLLLGLLANQNGGDGLRVERGRDNQFFGVVCDFNKRYGIKLAAGAERNSFWMPYLEGNSLEKKVSCQGLDNSSVESCITQCIERESMGDANCDYWCRCCVGAELLEGNPKDGPRTCRTNVLELSVALSADPPVIGNVIVTNTHVDYSTNVDPVTKEINFGQNLVVGFDPTRADPWRVYGSGEIFHSGTPIPETF